ncbi:MAG: glycosyltransferase, partial [Lutibacter sp.]|nr:glycosyltransferase [Lutibacter sp.]
FGIEPIVYTVANPSYPVLDTSLYDDIPPGLEIIQHPIWEPNQLFGLFAKKKNVDSLPASPSLFQRFLQYLRGNFFIPDARKYWVKPSLHCLLKYLADRPVDLVISTGPPHSVHLIALGLKKRLGLPWMADFRDPMTDLFYNQDLLLSKASKKKLKKYEVAILQQADEVITVGHTLKRSFEQYARKVSVVSNGYDDAPCKEVALDRAFTLSHIGLLPHQSNPTMLWKVLKSLIDENPAMATDLQINLVGNVSAAVRADIASYGLQQQTVFTGYVPHEQVVAIQRSSQVLVLLLPRVAGAEGIITGKLFEYLRAQRPILAIAPKKGDVFQIIEDTQAGVVIDFEEPDRLKKSIVALYEAYRAGTLTIRPKNIAPYHRKALTGKLSALIHEHLS